MVRLRPEPEPEPEFKKPERLYVGFWLRLCYPGFVTIPEADGRGKKVHTRAEAAAELRKMRAAGYRGEAWSV